MKICAYCGKELPDFALFCDDCGNRVAEAPAAETPVEDVPVQAPKKKRWVRILVAIVSAVAVLFFTFSFIFNWFGLFSPMARVSRATMRTLKADSLTLSAAVKVNSNNYYSEQSTTLRMVVDEKAQELNLYTNSSYYSEMNEKIKTPLPVGNVLKVLHRAGYEAYIVGGCVRDHLMGRIPGD